jgi:hypothetical protein
MALALGQMLNLGGSQAGPADQMLVAAEHPARVASSLGLVLLAAGFTGIAISAAADESTGPVTHCLA